MLSPELNTTKKKKKKRKRKRKKEQKPKIFVSLLPGPQTLDYL
jgi:hypothetical protein